MGPLRAHFGPKHGHPARRRPVRHGHTGPTLGPDWPHNGPTLGPASFIPVAGGVKGPSATRLRTRAVQTPALMFIFFGISFRVHTASPPSCGAASLALKFCRVHALNPCSSVEPYNPYEKIAQCKSRFVLCVTRVRRNKIQREQRNLCMSQLSIRHLFHFPGARVHRAKGRATREYADRSDVFVPAFRLVDKWRALYIWSPEFLGSARRWPPADAGRKGGEGGLGRWRGKACCGFPNRSRRP